MILRKILRKLWREFSSVVLKLAELMVYPLNHHVQHHNSLQCLGVSDVELNKIHKQLSWFNKLNYGYWQMDRSRLSILISLTKYSNTLDGLIAECGVYQGKTAQILFNFKSEKKKLYLFDTFEGFTIEDRALEERVGMGRDPGSGHINTSVELVKNQVSKPILKGPLVSSDKSLKIFIGKVQETLSEAQYESYSLVHLDMDLYGPTLFALKHFTKRMVTGGCILLHDYAVSKQGYSGVAKAVEQVDFTGFAGPIVLGDQSSALFVRLN